MALVAGNVRVGVTGAVYVAPVGTTAPTGYNSALNAAFADLGYLSDDGITEARDRTTDQIRGWQNNAVVRTTITDAGMTFAFTCIETKKKTVETFYGSSVTDGTGVMTIDPATTGGRKSWVIDIIDGTDTIRWYIPEGEVTEVGEVTYANGAAVGYEMTLTAYGTPTRWESSLIV